MKIIFKCVPFTALTLHELYALLALRQEVFMVEQNCAYLDADGKDLSAWHLLGSDTEGVLLAHTRLLPTGIAYPEYASIGRVVTSKTIRNYGVGKTLMQESLRHMERLYPQQPIKISAQSYLLKFYTNLGFESTGHAYIEDDIPHTSMIFKGL